MDSRKDHPHQPAAVATAAPAFPLLALPQTVEGWRRSADARRIDPGAIFEYMDGAGELYLAYRFDHLDVIEYRSDPGGDILVELYWMRTSDDAFGLLSGDWGGEPVDLGGSLSASHSPWPRALYGAGLLRVWSGELYARILAVRESGPARRAVLSLGRAIATRPTAGRAAPLPPRLAAAVAAASAPGFAIRADRLCFFRSHLVLNSAYFLSQRDVLGLGPAVEAVVVPWERPAAGGAASSRATIIAVRYPSAAAAAEALARFRREYLRDEGALADSGVRHLEDGWAAFRLAGRGVALVFDAPDRTAAEGLLAATTAAVEPAEAPHE